MYIGGLNMNTLTITDARKKIFEIAQEVQKPSVYYTLTENGLPKAVILSADEFSSWMETLETLREMPNLKKDIQETEKAMQTGEYKSWVNLQKLLAKEGFMLSEKPKNKYGVRTTRQTQRGKRVK